MYVCYFYKMGDWWSHYITFDMCVCDASEFGMFTNPSECIMMVPPDSWDYE